MKKIIVIIVLVGVGCVIWMKFGQETPRSISSPPPPAMTAEEARPEQERQARELGVPVEITNSLGMRFRLIPAGRFQMGSLASELLHTDQEGPAHTVEVEPFFMGAHEVTVEQYGRFMQATNQRQPILWSEQLQHPNCPAVCVSWDDAVAFCQWLSRQDSGTFRLPSEAEWEYACRAGTTTAYNTGSSLSASQANFDVGDIRDDWDPQHYLRDVGSYAPNAWDLYDMHGNVWEWCQDLYQDSYNGAPTDGSAWESPSDYSYLVKRGGSCYDSSRFCWSAARSYDPHGGRARSIGIRVVRTLE